ncbi:M13 family metallopeptidase [Nakamurella aerolata]|uniref:Peptidase M13 n=1 Tax=Nakamurella aerolata TaxID=1656892 RepID=A0A849AB01_9ACTN|nr:M13-type metalloendopeptidase [Nakamurella aerolata]NNG36311.1 peptidase M13 [Nakamurella aerolata]
MSADTTRADESPAGSAESASGSAGSADATTTRPQDDLYLAVNGQWYATAEIPGDLPATGSMYDVHLRSEEQLRELFQQAPAADADPVRAQVQTMYASFLDADRVEQLDLAPVQAEFAAIDAISSPADFARVLGELERTGVAGVVSAFVETDDKDSTRYLVNIAQGGLGLPDEGYYHLEQFAPIREAYRGHLERMFELAGVDDPAEAAGRVYSLEATLAEGHWNQVESRDATKTYNLRTAAEIAAAVPVFDWTGWITAMRDGGSADPLDQVVVRQPSYLETMNRALADLPLDDWKLWLRWNVLRARARYLPQRFVDENFDFYSRTLAGTTAQRERWKRGVSLVNGTLPEAAGKLFVDKHFPPAAKQRMDELVANLIAAYRASITELDWMSEQTKQRALDKLGKFRAKIGHPDSWRDYSAIEVRPDDLLGNVRRAAAFETDRQLAKIGAPVDRDEWLMPPQIVNAYYNPGTNEICFPAAILQPPMFDLAASDAANYGGIGAVIGHEIGHGFDDQGAKYDGDGNMQDWWTDADRAAFAERTDQMIEQFSQLEPLEVPGKKVNGALTVGENIGDLGGLTIALKAYEMANPPGTDSAHSADSGSGTGGGSDAADDAQRDERRRELFSSYALVWRTKRRKELAVQYLQIDPHSPPDLRANIARNLDEFHSSYHTADGDGMWLEPAKRVHIW